jgi:hypothetical protein
MYGSPIQNKQRESRCAARRSGILLDKYTSQNIILNDALRHMRLLHYWNPDFVNPVHSAPCTSQQ